MNLYGIVFLVLFIAAVIVIAVSYSKSLKKKNAPGGPKQTLSIPISGENVTLSLPIHIGFCTYSSSTGITIVPLTDADGKEYTLSLDGRLDLGNREPGQLYWGAFPDQERSVKIPEGSEAEKTIIRLLIAWDQKHRASADFGTQSAKTAVDRIIRLLQSRN